MKKTTEQKMGKWEPSGEKKIEKKPKKKDWVTRKQI